MFDRFDYESYQALLTRLTRGHRNCRFVDLAPGPPAGNYFILRHDVDHWPEAALKMARLEAQRGVRATYFLLPASENYNLLTHRYCRFPRQLVELGHEVGLHYDLGVYDAIGGDPLDLLRAQARQLGLLAGTPVRSIAMHNPSISGKDPFAGVTEFINAYDPKFTREIAYFSDSCGAWRTATIHALQGDPLPPALQLGIHPIFWDQTHADRWQRLEACRRFYVQTIEEDAKMIRVQWSNHAGLKEHDARTARPDGGR